MQYITLQINLKKVGDGYDTTTPPFENYLYIYISIKYESYVVCAVSFGTPGIKTKIHVYLRFIGSNVVTFKFALKNN